MAVSTRSDQTKSVSASADSIASLELGHGGIKAVAQATGLGERTVRRGCEQLRQNDLPSDPDGRRIRQPGGGRKPLAEGDPTLVAALEALA